MGTMKTAIFLAVLTAILIGFGGLVGGRTGAIVMLVIAGVMNFVSFWFSDRIILRMYGAEPVSEAEAPEVYRIVQDLSLRAGLPMPRVYIVPNDSPNAFATGRSPKHAAVAVHEGLLRILRREELAGVLGHELTHVLNRDTLIMTVAATVAGAISYLAMIVQWGAMFGGFGRSDDSEGEGAGNWIGLLVAAIVAPIAAALVQMAISRTREYVADEGGARLCGNPLSLADALRKLAIGTQRIPMQVNPATAHLFIVNPLSGGTFVSLFSTHPPLEERIRRLEALAGVVGLHEAPQRAV